MLFVQKTNLPLLYSCRCVCVCVYTRWQFIGENLGKMSLLLSDGCKVPLLKISLTRREVFPPSPPRTCHKSAVSENLVTLSPDALLILRTWYMYVWLWRSRHPLFEHVYLLRGGEKVLCVHCCHYSIIMDLRLWSITANYPCTVSWFQEDNLWLMVQAPSPTRYYIGSVVIFHHSVAILPKTPLYLSSSSWLYLKIKNFPTFEIQKTRYTFTKQKKILI